jgi:hypothetical protein
MAAGAASDIDDLYGFIPPGLLFDEIAFADSPLGKTFLVVFPGVIFI